MGATATLSQQALSVEPGGETQCEVRVRNSGWVVDQFTVEVLGSAEPWSQVEPPSISLLPGNEGVAKIRSRPPRHSATTAGPVPFGVRVASKEDPRGSVVEEGTITVGRFLDTFAELVPRSSRGRRSARQATMNIASKCVRQLRSLAAAVVAVSVLAACGGGDEGESSGGGDSAAGDACPY